MMIDQLQIRKNLSYSDLNDGLNACLLQAKAMSAALSTKDFEGHCNEKERAEYAWLLHSLLELAQEYHQAIETHPEGWAAAKCLDQEAKQ